MAITGRDDFKRKVRSSMRHLPREKPLLLSGALSLEYAA